MFEDLPIKAKILEWLGALEVFVREHFLVLDSVKQVALLFGVFIVGMFLKGWLERSVDGLRLPEFIKRYEEITKETLRPLVLPVFLVIVSWFCMYAMRSLGGGYSILNLVVSLLNAWVVIRFATILIKDPGWSKFVSVTAWSIAALNIVGLLEVTSAFLDSLAFSFGDTRFSIYGLIKGIIAIAVLFWIFSIFEGMLKRRIEGLTNVTPSAKVLLNKFLRVVLIVLGTLVAMDAIGIDLTALAVFSGAIGIGLGLGLQKVAANLVSGVILLLDRSVKPGDVISLGDTYGKIDKLAGRYVSVITRDGTEHLIPNEELITQRVENWSFSDTNVRQRALIGVDYSSDIKLAISLCEEAANETTRIVKTPAARCLLRDFADNSVSIELRYWVNDAQNGLGNVRSDVMMRIWDKFHANGVAFPYPQRDIHVKGVVPIKMVREEKE